MTVALADLILIGLIVLNMGLLYKTWDGNRRLGSIELLIEAFMDFMHEADDDSE